MSNVVVNPAVLSPLCPWKVRQASQSISTDNGTARMLSPDGLLGAPKAAGIAANFFRQEAHESFALRCVCRITSRRLFGHCFGGQPAPCGSLLFCFGCAAPRVTVSLEILFGKHRKDLSGPSVNAELRHLGAGPTRKASPGVTRTKSGNSTNGDTIMYQNKVTLIGFLGNDAEVRTANDRSFTTFSLATKSSYKDRNTSQYISHTEWHRCVIFGKLSEFAKTLTKGAHVQVEGELRSREYISKKTETEQRIWEIRVGTILKLDRAEYSLPEDQLQHDAAPEGEAA